MSDLPPEGPSDSMGASDAGGHGHRPHIPRWIPRFRARTAVAVDVFEPDDEAAERARPRAERTGDEGPGDEGVRGLSCGGSRSRAVMPIPTDRRRVDSIESSCRRTLPPNQCILYQRDLGCHLRMVERDGRQYLKSLLRPSGMRIVRTVVWPDYRST